jgi:flagellar biogenesis protein FliO
MWALNTPRTSADNSAAAKQRRGIAATAGAIAVLIGASTSLGQQGPSRVHSIDRSSVSPSSLGDVLGHRLQQFRNAGTQTSDTDSPQSAGSERLQFSANRMEDAGVENTPISTASATVAESTVVPAPFLDLTQEKQALQAVPTSENSVQGSLEITAGSNPTHVLMRAVAWIVIALCIFSLTILGLRHWQRQRGLLPTTNSRSRVLETLSLGPGRTVSLIELAGFRALVASDAGGIRSLVLAPLSFPDELLEVGQTSDPQVSNLNV